MVSYEKVPKIFAKIHTWELAPNPLSPF